VRRIVLLSALTPGRCFTLSEPPSAFEEDETAERTVAGRSILTPELAWKILTIQGAQAETENALGEKKSFATSERVVELPRQGWDRLATRVRDEA